eukprot:gene7162-7377_t
MVFQLKNFIFFERPRPAAPLLPTQMEWSFRQNDNKNHHPAATSRKWLGGKGRKIQTSSTGGAGGISHVIAKPELTLEVAFSGMAAKFVTACHAAADLAVEPTLNKELSLSWRLYMTEQDCTNKDRVIATLQDQSRADRLAAEQRFADLEAAHGCELAKADLALRLAKTREAAQAKGFQQAKQAAEAAEAKAAAADATTQAAVAAQAATEKDNRSLKEVLNLQQQTRQGRIEKDKLILQVQMLQASQGQPINLHQISPKPWPGALSRAIQAEAQVAALQVQVRALNQLLAERDHLSADQPGEQPPDVGVPPAVRTSANLTDDPEQGGMPVEYDDDLDDVIAQQAAVGHSLQAWLKSC